MAEILEHKSFNPDEKPYKRCDGNDFIGCIDSLPCAKQWKKTGRIWLGKLWEIGEINGLSEVCEFFR